VENWENNCKMYSIKEIAERLEISEMTVRRRIQRGEISAVKALGPYGEQWMIPADQLPDAVTTDMEVIPVNRQASVEELRAAFAHELREARRAMVADIRDEIREETDELKEQVNQLDRTIQKSIKERDDKLMFVIRAIQEREQRKWWRRLW
jgi:excisionase family DNA binding protein